MALDPQTQQTELYGVGATRGFQDFLVQLPDTAGIPFDIVHNLNSSNPAGIRYQVLQAPFPVNLYHDPGDTWSVGHVVLRATANGGSIRVRLTVDESDQTALDAGSTDARGMLIPSGVLTLGGGQIKFPATQNPSTDANTLDDYEEGTWTPSLLFGGANVGMTYAIQQGYYTKIGRVVVADCNIQLTAKGGSVGPATITGLPFAANANSFGAGVWNQVVVAGVAVAVTTTAIVGAAIYPLTTPLGGVATQMTDVNFGNPSYFRLTFVYFV